MHYKPVSTADCGHASRMDFRGERAFLSLEENDSSLCNRVWVNQEHIRSALPWLIYSTDLLVQSGKEIHNTGDLHCSKITGREKGHINQPTYKGNQNFT